MKTKFWSTVSLKNSVKNLALNGRVFDFPVGFGYDPVVGISRAKATMASRAFVNFMICGFYLNILCR
ncbi:hypothetical protein N8642_00980 [bacterium]|nr:hypothetical protein [bacterium]